MIVREKQIGSIKTFFAIGVVLACILVGSIFYLKNRGELALTTQKEPTSQDSKAEESTKSGKDSNKEKTIEKPAVSVKKDTDSSDETVVASGDLPTTGPESIATEAALLFIATFLIVSFVQSKILKPDRSLETNN